VAEPEIACGEGVGGVLERGDRLVGAGRGVVGGGDVELQRVRCWVEVDAAVGGAAVVLLLEAEARIAGAVGVRGRAEDELVPGDEIGRASWREREWNAVVGQAGRNRKGRELQRVERGETGVVGVAGP